MKIMFEKSSSLLILASLFATAAEAKSYTEACLEGFLIVERHWFGRNWDAPRRPNKFIVEKLVCKEEASTIRIAFQTNFIHESRAEFRSPLTVITLDKTTWNLVNIRYPGSARDRLRLGDKYQPEDWSEGQHLSQNCLLGILEVRQLSSAFGYNWYKNKEIERFSCSESNSKARIEFYQSGQDKKFFREVFTYNFRNPRKPEPDINADL